MKLNLPKIYPITDSRLTMLSHAEQVEKLVEGSAKFIQLRDKLAAPKDFYESAKQALEIARTRNVKIIINDRVDIALALKADGVHLGQDDLPPARARQILGDEAIIGFSTHTLKQIFQAIKLPINYLAIGPVYPTWTKENLDEVVGIEMVRQARELAGDFPLVAIGGIDSKNFQSVLDAGADSVAVISDLLSDADKIEEKMKMFLR